MAVGPEAGWSVLDKRELGCVIDDFTSVFCWYPAAPLCLCLPWNCVCQSELAACASCFVSVTNQNAPTAPIDASIYLSMWRCSKLHHDKYYFYTNLVLSRSGPYWASPSFSMFSISQKLREVYLKLGVDCLGVDYYYYFFFCFCSGAKATVFIHNRSQAPTGASVSTFIAFQCITSIKLAWPGAKRLLLVTYYPLIIDF